MPRRLPTKDDLLEVLSKNDHAMHAREIFAALDLSEAAYSGVLRILDDLVYNGVLQARPGQRFKVIKAKQASRGHVLTGQLSVNARGFGFVATEDGQGDIFIPGEALGGGMQGDRVEVRVVSTSSRGREGAIERIVDRKTVRVAGVLHRKGANAWLEPDDTRVRGPIELPRALDSKGPDGNSGEDGDAAVVRITRYPEFTGENPQGVIEAVLGRPGELTVEVQKLLLVAGVQALHSDEAVAEAEAYGEHVPAAMLADRMDLTHIPLPTIDPEDARDHDDAVWVERDKRGGYRAWIAIADVSSYVKPGTAIDREALLRGASVYLPDRAIPMLPRALSSNLCSLLPDVVRLCLCAIVDLDESGKVIGCELVSGYMKSAAKLTYGGVARALGLTEAPPREPLADSMVEGLRVANELSRLLRGRRMKRGALELELPEPRVTMGPNGEPVTVTRRGGDAGVKKAYELIEELMILANESVAAWLIEREIPSIFRVHEPPDVTKLQRLATMCEALGVPFDLDDAQSAKGLSELVRGFSEHEMVGVLNNLLLRSMKQAVYDINNRGHFGLASEAYLHFTSPIRRYPDLVVHRSVHHLLKGKTTDRSSESRTRLGESAVASSQAERRIMEVERNVLDLYRVFIMREKVGETFEGLVAAIVSGGVFVTLDEPFVDVFVRYEDLGPGGFQPDDDGLRAVAGRSGETVQLGDRLSVEIVETSLLRRLTYARRNPDEGTSVRRPRLPRSRVAPTAGRGGGGRGRPGRSASPGPDASRGKPGRGKPGRGKPSGGSSSGGKPTGSTKGPAPFRGKKAKPKGKHKKKKR